MHNLIQATRIDGLSHMGVRGNRAMTGEMLTCGCHASGFHTAHKLSRQRNDRLRLLMKATIPNDLADAISVKYWGKTEINAHGQYFCCH